MLTNKAIAIAKEIDIARCKGNWQAIPELARRYKKHNPNGLVLEQCILAEASLNEIIQTHRQDSSKTYAKDTPNAATLSTRLDPELIKPIQRQLATALGDRDSSEETRLQKQLTRIVLAKTYFESGEYHKSRDTLEEVGYESTESLGYTHILYMQALAIQAMSLELVKEEQRALEVYDRLVSRVNQIPNLIDRAIVDWAEEGLYRGTLFALSEGCHFADVPSTMNLIRAYQKVCSSQSNNWRIYKRIIVTRYSLIYLSNLYQQGQYQPPVDYSQTVDREEMSESEFAEAKNLYNHQLFSIEIMQLHTVYEKLVYSIASFPKSGQSSTLVLDFVNRLAADFELVGGSEIEKRGYVEALNRASLKTFNSPCVTRHLFHALIRLGDYEEAEHALRTYLYLVGLESKTMLDARSTTSALASDAFGFNTPVPSADEVEELAISEQAKKTDGPQRSLEIESIEHKVMVLVTAVRMYCQELSKGAEAVYMAEMAEHVYTAELTSRDQHDESFILLGAQVYRTLGASLAFLAGQTFDSERRPKYHERALASLKKSLAIDNESWETYYQIALELAEMRDVLQAIQMVTKSIQYNANYLPSWHLLALLCTCPIKDSHAQALKTCELALSEVSEQMMKDNWIDYSDEIAHQISLQMTQTLLVDRVHGAEAALASQEALFQVFGKIVVPELIPDATNTAAMLHEAISNGTTKYGMVLSGSLGNMSNGSSFAEASVIDQTKSSRGRSGSNASYQTNGGTPSVSSFTGRKFYLAEMFNQNDSSDAQSVRSVPPMATSKQGNKMGLLDPKNLIRNKHSKKDAVSLHNIESAGSTRKIPAKGISRGGSVSSIHSTTPSTISTNTLLQAATALTRPTAHTRLQHQRSCRLLCDLWLLSAEAFLKSGKIEEALKAVSEAENVDWTTHAGVWCLLGRIHLAENQPEKAIKAFQKGLVTKPNDVECRVWLAKAFMDQGHLELAEGLLQVVTQENGWNNPTAWFYLGLIYKQTDRLSRTKDCLFYALELESTTPIQPFTILPCFV